VFVLIDEAADSQFDDAVAATKLAGGLPDGLICLALTGARFRGQRHRPWAALRGNLHLTAHYRFDQLSAREAQASLTMIPSLAAAEAIESVSAMRLKPEIKWVNDVWLSGKKVSGGLTATQVTGDLIDSAVFGIGVNLAVAPEISPTPFVPRAGCLAGDDPSLQGMLPALLREVVFALDRAVQALKQENHASIFSAYRARAGFIGKVVRIWPEGTEDAKTAPILCEGRVTDLFPDLSLSMEGRSEPIRSGRLAYLSGTD
jgi:biotin-(acetyl-CoA carboxylase) ligase